MRTDRLRLRGGPDVPNELIERARSGDEAALRKLYEEQRPRVMRLAFALLGDAAEAEDVMQDVLVYALTNLDQYDPDRGSFATWVNTIALSRTRDRGRRLRRQLTHLRDSFFGLPTRTENEPHRAIEAVDAAAAVGPALAKLTRIQREAIVLREVEGLSFREIGEQLGIPMRTAQARVTSAHSALRKALQDSGADGFGSQSDRRDTSSNTADESGGMSVDRPSDEKHG
jgi:RNA polymerase sigma-70 factor (ECF subfamily)